MIAGFCRGSSRSSIMRLVDIVPLDPGDPARDHHHRGARARPANVILVLGLRAGRAMRASPMARRWRSWGRPYVRLAAFNGASASRLLGRHVLPNIAGAIIVVATLEFGLMVLFEAGLSFLGLGVQPPMPSWGSILSVGRNYSAAPGGSRPSPGSACFCSSSRST